MNNITETSYLKGTHDLWFLFLLVAINLPKPVGKSESNNKAVAVQDSTQSKEPARRADALVTAPFRSTEGLLTIPCLHPTVAGYALD
jgi:hypothetical protein